MDFPRGENPRTDRSRDVFLYVSIRINETSHRLSLRLLCDPYETYRCEGFHDAAVAVCLIRCPAGPSIAAHSIDKVHRSCSCNIFFNSLFAALHRQRLSFFILHFNFILYSYNNDVARNE